MQGSAELIINKGIEDVWAYVSDFGKMEEWVEGVSDGAQVSEGDLEVGAKLRSKYRYRGKTVDVEYEVTEFNPPSRFSAKSTEGPFPFEILIELTTYVGSTRVTNTIDAGSDSVMTNIVSYLLGSFVRKSMNRRMLKELETLKSVLESR